VNKVSAGWSSVKRYLSSGQRKRVLPGSYVSEGQAGFIGNCKRKMCTFMRMSNCSKNQKPPGVDNLNKLELP